MNAASAVEIMRRVVGYVGQARTGTTELGVRVDAIWGNTERLTIDGRRTDVAAAIAEGAGEIRDYLVVARGALMMGNAEVDGILNNLRYVSPEVMATRALILSPILSGALERPEALVNAYRPRFGDLADRRILEESASVVIDGLGGSDGGAFEERWRFLSEELEPSLPEAELEAKARSATLDELGGYLEAAQLVVEFDLSSLDPEGGPTTGQMIGAERHNAALNRYEDEHKDELGGLISLPASSKFHGVVSQ